MEFTAKDLKLVIKTDKGEEFVVEDFIDGAWVFFEPDNPLKLTGETSFEVDLLENGGRVNTQDCISTEDLTKLLED